MGSTHLKKCVAVHASREKTWQVLTDGKYTADWMGAFSPGSRAETDWKAGSRARFVDESGCGLVSRIEEASPGEKIVIVHQGVLENGSEQFDSEEARKWKGLRETYQLGEMKGVTTLHIDQETPEDFKESLSGMWDKAVERIKALAESQD